MLSLSASWPNSPASAEFLADPTILFHTAMRLLLFTLWILNRGASTWGESIGNGSVERWKRGFEGEYLVFPEGSNVQVSIHIYIYTYTLSLFFSRLNYSTILRSSLVASWKTRLRRWNGACTVCPPVNWITWRKLRCKRRPNNF